MLGPLTRGLCALALACIGGGAMAAEEAAAPAPPPERVVLWMDQQLPEEGDRAKAQRRMGGEALHLSQAALLYPPAPWSTEDKQRVGTLGTLLKDTRDTREEFDVELTQARKLLQGIDKVELLRNDTERNALLQTLLWQASAVTLAYRPAELKTSPDARDYRVELPGLITNRPLLDALALEPDRAYTRGELPEAATYQALVDLKAALTEMQPGTVMLSALPPGATLVVDGRPTPATDALELPPGHHYLHLVIDDQVCARAKVNLLPGGTVDLPVAFDEPDRQAAERAVEQQLVAQLPPSVTDALDRVRPRYGNAAIYLGAVTADGQVVLLPYAGGAELSEKRLVTFVVGAEGGGGVMATPSFYHSAPDNFEAPGELIVAPTIQGALDLELGITNFAILAGAELHITPTQGLLYGSGDDQVSSDENQETQLYTRVYGGLGAYLMRPDPNRKRATILLGGNYGWFSPGHLGWGARLTFGVPMDKRNALSLTLHGWTGDPMEGFPADEPLYMGGLRLGFQGTL